MATRQTRKLAVSDLAILSQTHSAAILPMYALMHIIAVITNDALGWEIEQGARLGLGAGDVMEVVDNHGFSEYNPYRDAVIGYANITIARLN